MPGCSVRLSVDFVLRTSLSADRLVNIPRRKLPVEFLETQNPSKGELSHGVVEKDVDEGPFPGYGEDQDLT